MTIDELIQAGRVSRDSLAPSLVRSGRVFANGWWHGCETDSAIELMQRILEDELHLDLALPVQAIEAQIGEGSKLPMTKTSFVGRPSTLSSPISIGSWAKAASSSVDLHTFQDGKMRSR